MSFGRFIQMIFGIIFFFFFKPLFWHYLYPPFFLNTKATEGKTVLLGGFYVKFCFKKHDIEVPKMYLNGLKIDKSWPLTLLESRLLSTPVPSVSHW